jgi:hypothetical protein
MGIEWDLTPGEQLLPRFRRSIKHLAASSLSPETICTHVDNLWSPGAEIIPDLHYDKTLRTLPAERLLRQSVHGPYGPSSKSHVHRSRGRAGPALRHHVLERSGGANGDLAAAMQNTIQGWNREAPKTLFQRVVALCLGKRLAIERRRNKSH